MTRTSKLADLATPPSDLAVTVIVEVPTCAVAPGTMFTLLHTVPDVLTAGEQLVFGVSDNVTPGILPVIDSVTGSEPTLASAKIAFLVSTPDPLMICTEGFSTRRPKSNAGLETMTDRVVGTEVFPL